MTIVYQKPKSLTETKFHYCPGCTHGTIHRILAEVVDELNMQENIIGVAPVGCAVLAYEYFDFDMQQAAHGRAPAVATGIKRVLPKNIVFTYQGDGDLASIGMAEIVHAAARGEKITVIFVNNAIFGMTGGQMAPTTLPGQVTNTTPTGRNTTENGFPIPVSEMLAALKIPGNYIIRTSVHDPKNIKLTKNAVKEAFKNQINNKGFSMVEILSTCPTNWGKTPVESLRWIAEQMISYYPLGIKVREEI